MIFTGKINEFLGKKLEKSCLFVYVQFSFSLLDLEKSFLKIYTLVNTGSVFGRSTGSVYRTGRLEQLLHCLRPYMQCVTF